YRRALLRTGKVADEVASVFDWDRGQGGRYLRQRHPYHRQRLLLFFLEFVGKSLRKVELQKPLLLYTEEMQSRHYAFVPFRYGCYSFPPSLSLLRHFQRDERTSPDHIVRTYQGEQMHWRR
ncbi:hypothetical protein M1N84_02555, partial [Dehalococcoidia bacterium]|nr:hypothetical protein [Dehalococcoidia bacterium]